MDACIILGRDLSSSLLLQFKSTTTWSLCSSLLHVRRQLSCHPAVFSLVGGPFNVSQAQRPLPAFLCTLSIWFLAFPEMMLQAEDSTPSEQSLSTFLGWLSAFSQPCGITDSCLFCDPLQPLTPFVELLPGHPHLIFVQFIILKCCASGLSLVKWLHTSYFRNSFCFFSSSWIQILPPA